MSKQSRHVARPALRRTALLLPLLVLIGCSAGNEAVQEPAGHSENTSASLSPDRKKDIAVKLFISGSVHESKGEHQRAIDEYFRALHFDESPTLYAAIARNYSALARFDMTENFAGKAVQLEPDSRENRELLADALLRNGRYDSAAAEYEHLLQYDPGNFEARYTLARLYQGRKPERAVQLLESLLDQVGSDPELLFSLAETYSTLGRFDEAFQTLETLLRLEPDNESIYLTMAGLASQSMQWEKAQRLFEELVERFPDRMEHRISLAEVLMEMESWAVADSILSGLLFSSEIADHDAMRIGELYLQYASANPMREAKAMETADHLRNRYPDDWRPLWFRAALIFNDRRFEAASTELLLVLRKDPDNVPALDLLARSYLSLEDFESAIKPLQTIIDRKAGTSETYAYLGYALNRLGKPELAITALRKSLDLDSTRMDALSTLALTYDGLRRHAESDALYESAINRYEQNALPRDGTYYLLLNNYAYTLSERGTQLDRALDMSQRAVGFEEQNSSYLDTMGWVYFKLKNYSLALQYIQSAIDRRLSEEEPVGSVLYDHLGDVYHAMGDKAMAMKYWNLSLMEEPTNTLIREKILSNAP